jgi:MFS family permease
VINSFGAFQTYYVGALNRSPADISWVGSIEIFFLYSLGVFSGRLCDAGFFYPVFASGIVLVALGTMAASACTQYWQIFLAQGVCVGLGNGLLFCPALAIVATYWGTRRSLAIGIGASGSVTGGIIFPLLVKSLLPTAGFGWTMRAIGFIQVAMLAISLFSLKPRVPPRRTGSLVEWSAFKELEYTFYTLGSFLVGHFPRSPMYSSPG